MMMRNNTAENMTDQQKHYEKITEKCLENGRYLKENKEISYMSEEGKKIKRK